MQQRSWAARATAEFEHRGAHLAWQSGEREKPLSAPRILIADDDASIRGLLRVIAERNGILADEAANGVSALELLDRYTYDVLLLDLAMPMVNGFDLIERVRHKSRRPAIIVLSALSRPALGELDPSIVQCIVRKPFDVDLLMTLIVSAATALWQRREQTARHATSERAPEARL
jgi:DNA-binding response OmpR family regulator